MKHVLFTIIFATAVLFAQAQIELEHTYSNYVDRVTLSTGKYYCTNDGVNLKLYNENHELYKSIDIIQWADYDYSGTTCISDKLFNNDDKVEFVVSFRNPSTGIYICRIYNEDGTKIKDLGNCYTAYVYNTSTGYKLHTYSPEKEVSIYSLPGAMLKSANVDVEQSVVYPNPAQDYVKLQTQTVPEYVTITDMQGLEVDRVYTNGSHEIDVRSLVPGQYIIQHGESSSVFIKQ